MAREPSVSVPKGFKLPWPARTIAEAMPGMFTKRSNGRKQKDDRDVVGKKRKA